MFKNNTLIVTNYINKKELLKEISKQRKLIDIKIISMQDLIDKYFFTYDLNTIYYLMDKYHYALDIALEYLSNLIYINDDIDNSKYMFLKSLKQELKDNDLLRYDLSFREYIKKKKIIFYKFNSFNKHEKSLIESLKKETEVEIVSKEVNKYNPVVHEFNTINEEVSFVAFKIASLIDKDVPLSKIKITNIDNDYRAVLERIFALYNLKIKPLNTLYGKSIAKEYLANFSLPLNVDFLKDKYDSDTLNSLISILNKYVTFSDPKIVKELIIHDLKNTSFSIFDDSNIIEEINYKDYDFKDDEYIFMLNFNLNNIPIMHKDDQYLDDGLREKLLLDTSRDQNIREKKIVIKTIHSIKNLVITYKLASPFRIFYPASLIEDLKMNVVKDHPLDNISYSKINNELLLAEDLDDLIKYQVTSDELDILYNNYSDIKYLSYDNTYKQIDALKLRDYINDQLVLSYSSMNNYYKCRFKYYLANILKLDIFEENFNTYLGSLFHYCFEKALKSDYYDVVKLVNDFISNNERCLSNKEKFFIDNLEDEITFIIETIKNQNKYTSLDKTLYEEKIEVVKDDDIKVIFKGFVDKIIYSIDNDKTIAAIIDYKTGNTPYKLSYALAGLNLQLPIYLYLASHSSSLRNVTFAGFYLQKVLNSKEKIDNKKNYLELRKEALKLEGYSNSNCDILAKLDKSFEDSKLIKSLSITKSGSFSSNANVISNDEISELIKLVDKKIDEAVKEISKANFNINPKYDLDVNLSCTFCRFSDICFKTPLDKEEVVKAKDLSFLGGDYNA